MKITQQLAQDIAEAHEYIEEVSYDSYEDIMNQDCTPDFEAWYISGIEHAIQTIIKYLPEDFPELDNNLILLSRELENIIT